MKVRSFSDIVQLWKGSFPRGHVPVDDNKRKEALIDLLETLKEAGYQRFQVNGKRREIIDACINKNSNKAKKWADVVDKDLKMALAVVLPDMSVTPETFEVTEEPTPEYKDEPSEYKPEPKSEPKAEKAEEEDEESLPVLPPKTPIPPPPSEKDLPARPHIIYDEDMERILGFKK